MQWLVWLILLTLRLNKRCADAVVVLVTQPVSTAMVYVYYGLFSVVNAFHLAVKLSIFDLKGHFAVEQSVFLGGHLLLTCASHERYLLLNFHPKKKQLIFHLLLT